MRGQGWKIKYVGIMWPVRG